MVQKRRVWDSQEWVAYYRRNVEDPVPIPWEVGAELTDVERAAIAASVQGFQLGESSEGRHLYQRAKRWSVQNGDAVYSEAIRLFIVEEQRHARDLGRFMDLNDIPRVREAWPDTAFRFLRRAAGLELSIVVLVTAEVIAQVYYVALRDATFSSVLRTLCERILRDEEEHVRFQSERLALLARNRSKMGLWFRRVAQRGLMLATLLVVWSMHRRAYRAGGYSFLRFASATWAALGRALSLMDPHRYDWNIASVTAPASAR